ncbi:hypothetical protein FPZ45_10695 [Cohnella terricola]|uniref:Uncharacterized protein n=1 Tax=Cohnella terricola TaxID=1289167 RepID=A0A559JKT8_9BACL|nr:hypothetical protein FPZ45_10695 [Cohnella terricola]
MAEKRISTRQTLSQRAGGRCKPVNEDDELALEPPGRTDTPRAMFDKLGVSPRYGARVDGNPSRMPVN